jgi:hypothetical protein
MMSASLRRLVEAQRLAADAGALARDSHMEVVQQLQSTQAEVAQRTQEVRAGEGTEGGSVSSGLFSSSEHLSKIASLSISTELPYFGPACARAVVVFSNGSGEFLKLILHHHHHDQPDCSFAAGCR